jgi:sterol desaturase/sphingolipid hydroxylase (fatty acid hydroxylase superfamily)
MLSAPIIEQYGALITWLISSSLVFFRYLLFAAPAYVLFYVWRRKHFYQRKIQKYFPDRSKIMFEVKHSMLAALVFGLFMLLIVVMNSNGLTMIYHDLRKYGYLYLFFSWVVLVLLHDTYFYWTHRLMHHRALFRWVHRVHHQSHNPTPWASFSFHPLEALVEFAFLPVVVCIMPLHPVVILGWSLWMIVWNVLGHLGFELFPKRALSHPAFRWFNTSTHHNLHHQRSRGNFGLYFNFWDTWMGTNDETYREAFKKSAR